MNRFRLQFRLFAALVLSLASWQGVASQPSAIMPGDINCDRIIDVSDVNVIIDNILGRQDLEPRAYTNADLTHDGIIDVSDVNALIDLILGKGYTHADPRTLVVALRDGSVHSFPLADKPEVSFVDDEMLVKSETETSYFVRNQLYQVYYNLDQSSAPRHSRLKEPVADNPNQFAVYIYRNDNSFNAHVNLDIESIRFSAVGTDSVWYDTPVVQEVWTPDSVFRTPLAAVDSITFEAPKPQFKDNVYHITASHLPYAVAADTLSFSYSKSIPSSMLPQVGQVVVSDVFDTPFESGFSGRVEQINQYSDRIEIVCSQVGITDVFSKLILVGKCSSEVNAPNKARRKAWTDPWFDAEAQGLHSIDIPTDFELKVLKDIFKVESKKPTLNVSYYFYIDDMRYSFAADAYLIHKDLEFTVAFKKSDFMSVASGASEYLTNFILGKGDQEEAEEKWYEHEYDNFKLPIPFKAGPVNFVFEIAPVFKLEGDVELDLTSKTSARQHIGFHKEGWTPALMVSPLISLALGDLNYAYVQDPIKSKSLTLKADGSATLGLSLQLKANLVSKKLLHAAVGGEYDIKASGTLQFNLYDDENPVSSFYDVIKDTKVKAERFVKIKGEIGVSPWKFLTLKGSFKIPIYKAEYCIMPHFTQPALPTYNNGRWEYNFTQPLSMYSRVSKDVLVPCKPGLRIEDLEGNFIREYTSDESYQYEAAWSLTPLNLNVSDLQPGTTYKCSPTISYFGLPPFKVTPSNEFTVPEPMTLGADALTMQKGKTANVLIKGGWGVYHLYCDGTICTAEIKYDTDGKRYILLTGVSDGKSTVTVKDMRTEETKQLLVTVTDQQGNLALSTDAVQVAVNATETVDITGGSGQYEVASSDHQVARAALQSNGDRQQVVIKGYSAGTAVVTVTDTQTGQTANVNVTVTGSSYNPQTQTITIPSTNVSFKMVAVEGGTFTMGASDDDAEAYSWEKPAHQVTLSSYSIGQTEVTQELWQAVMGSNPSGHTGDLQRPVENVSWDDCQEFIRKLNSLTGKNFRLPTEAEWEYAARGGSKSQGYKFAGSNTIGDVAWYGGNSGSKTHPVGTKAPNELGLYDMSGNVWEWCQDWYGENYYSSSPSSNPTGPSSGSDRVIRGGSWNYYARSCRVSLRNSWGADNRNDRLGFRLAL